MARGLCLSAELQAQVIAHCRRRYPKEACGLLAGKDGVVGQVYPMRNIEDSPIGYAMDPREQLQVEKQMRQQQQRLLGIYHSHTASAAYPSSVDVSLALSPEISYVLVSLKDQTRPEVKSYRIDGRTITPEPIEEAPGASPASGRAWHFVSVEGMLCAQALAVVDQALTPLAAGARLDVRGSSPDVAADLAVWAKDRGHQFTALPEGAITLMRGPA